MVPIKRQLQIRYRPDYGRPDKKNKLLDLRDQKSNLDSLSEPVAQRIEVLSLYGSRWALSEDSGFNSYPSRPEVYLVKTLVR